LAVATVRVTNHTEDNWGPKIGSNIGTGTNWMGQHGSIHLFNETSLTVGALYVEPFRQRLYHSGTAVTPIFGWDSGTGTGHVAVMNEDSYKIGMKQFFESISLFMILYFIYIEREGLWCFANHKIFRVSYLYFEFKNSNGRSKPLNMIFLLKYLLRSNFTFFLFFLLFFMGTKSLVLNGTHVD
jgi:hypothetical protein